MDPSGPLATLVGSYGLAAIFVVMLLKEIGVPVPLPSDLLMIGAGVQLAAGSYSAIALLVAIAVAVLVGGSIQFLIARSAGRAIVYRLAAVVGIGAERMDRAVAQLGARGARAVFVGVNIPGARAAVVPAAGVARLPMAPMTLAMVTGSVVFYGWHVALGYVVGPGALALLDAAAAPVLAGVVALAVAGLAGWLLLRRRGRPADSGAVRAWTEAACPACLAITALRQRD